MVSIDIARDVAIAIAIDLDGLGTGASDPYFLASGLLVLDAEEDTLASGGGDGTYLDAIPTWESQVTAEDPYLYLPGVIGNYASIPDSAALDGFGDFTLQVDDVTLSDWTPSATAMLLTKWEGASERAFVAYVKNTGELAVEVSFNGSAATTYTSTSTTGLANGATASLRWLRTGSTIKIYVDSGSGFVQLGSDIAGVSTILFNSNHLVEVGAYSAGSLPTSGSIGRARIWSDATQTTNVLDVNFATDSSKGDTSFTATSGQTVTVNSTSINTPAAIQTGQGSDARQVTGSLQGILLKHTTAGGNYLHLPGVAGNDASIPDSADLDGFGAFTFEVDATLGDWTPPSLENTLMSKYDTSSQRAWYLALTTGGIVVLVLSEDGTSPATSSSTVSTGLADGARAKIRASRTASAGVITFEVDSGSGFVQLGDAVANPRGTLHNSTAGLFVGSRNGANPVLGKIHRARVWSDATQTTNVLDVNFASDARHDELSFTATSGQKVTVNQSGINPASIIGHSVIRTDGSDDFMQGTWGSNLTDGRLFMVSTVLGGGGESGARAFSVNKNAESTDTTVTGAALFTRNGTSSDWRAYHNSSASLLQSSKWDGRFLAQVDFAGSAQSSKTNNSNLVSATDDWTGLSSNKWAFSGDSEDALQNAALDVEFIGLYPASMTDEDAAALVETLNERFELFAPYGPTNPLSLDPYLYFDAEESVDSAGQPVSGWTQVTAGGNQLARTLAQTTGSLQPAHDAADEHITFDAVDDKLTYSASVAQAGYLVVATSNGVFVNEVDADSIDDITALGSKGTAFENPDLYALVLLPTSVTDAEITGVIRYLVNTKGATKNPLTSIANYFKGRADIVEPKLGDLDLTGVTNFTSAWRSCASLTSFPANPLTAGTDFSLAWLGCSSLTSFLATGLDSGTNFYQTWSGCTALATMPAIPLTAGLDFRFAWFGNTSLTSFLATGLNSGTNFTSAWNGCSSLATMPAIPLTAGTSFTDAWSGCVSLTSFLATGLDSGTNFAGAWSGCSTLATMPAIPLTAGTNFTSAWNGCTSLTSFLATGFDTGSAINFSQAWENCESLITFPATDLSAGTSFSYAWRYCDGMTTFLATGLDSGTGFIQAWYLDTALTEMPAIPLTAGTNFISAWSGCTSLTSFLATGLDSGTDFSGTWQNCTALATMPAIPLTAGLNFSNAWRGSTSLTSFLATGLNSGTNFTSTWEGCTALATMPAIPLTAGLNFTKAWYLCSSLTSFLATGLNSGTNFTETWRSCTALTTMPAIPLTAGTDFTKAWQGCTALTSFLATGLNSGTNFSSAWNNCASLETMPAIPLTAGTIFTEAWKSNTSLTSWLVTDVDKGEVFYLAWNGCTALITFPANVFDGWAPSGGASTNCFNEAWGGCTALSATSVENILNSLATAAVVAPASGKDITIDFNAGSGTPSVAAAVTTLKGLSPAWTITLNGTPQ